MKHKIEIKKLLLAISLLYVAVASAQLPSNFPALSIVKTGDTAPGYLFLTVSTDVEGIGYYAFMMDDDGEIFKYHELEHKVAYDFKVQPSGLISYAQSRANHSYTEGAKCVHMVLDTSMNIVDSFQLGNKYIADAHDFQLLPNGHALAFGYYLTQMDLSGIVGASYSNASVSGVVIQELDQDKNVIWQWRSWDHYTKEDIVKWKNAVDDTFVQFQVNAINIDNDGNIFISTPDWTKKISRQTGEVMWHLGGDENEFSFVGVDSLEGMDDIAGHAFHRLENGNVLVYNNASGNGTSTSAAHEFHIDEVNKTVTLIKTFSPNSNIAGVHGGNAQRLPNGNTLVGWGGTNGADVPVCTEFDADGNAVFEAWFDNKEVESYRAVRFPYPPEHKYDVLIQETYEGNTYEFMQGDTLDIGVEVDATTLVTVGYNELMVETFNYAPKHPRFDGRAPMVLAKTVFLSGFMINYIGGDIKFEVDKFGVANPENITIYFRMNEEDTFMPLTTNYNPEKGEISAEFDEFGEFIFAYPDVAHIVSTPYIATPKNETTIDPSQPVKLEWAHDGFFNSFNLQVSTDIHFNNLVIDESGMKNTLMELTDLLPNEKYYWRVKTLNDAGESNWSETARFNYGVVGVKQNTEREEPFNIYPMPADEEIYVAFNLRSGTMASIVMYDMSGKKVAVLQDNIPLRSGRQKLNFDLKAYPEGSYLLKINTGNSVVSKLITISR